MKTIFLKIIIWAIVLVGLGYAGFYFWQHRYEYFFQGDSINTKEQSVSPGQLSQGGSVSGNTEESDSGKDEEDDEEQDDEDNDDNYFVPSIHKSDCVNECEGKRSVEIEYRYCREICGLNDIRDLKNSGNTVVEEEIDGEECDDIESALEEDICWKTKAIKEKKDKYCDEIYSEALSKVCHDRVLEEIIN